MSLNTVNVLDKGSVTLLYLNTDNRFREYTSSGIDPKIHDAYVEELYKFKEY